MDKENERPSVTHLHEPLSNMLPKLLNANLGIKMVLESSLEILVDIL